MLYPAIYSGNLLVQTHVIDAAFSGTREKCNFSARPASTRSCTQPIREDTFFRVPLEPPLKLTQSAKIAGLKMAQATDRHTASARSP